MLRLAIDEADGYLRRAIALARQLEARARIKGIERRLDLVGYGLLIRNRRLAEAIRCLGAVWSYEGRMLLRSMIEIYINYAWIRLAKSHSRSTRYLRFEVLEQLAILDDLEGSMDPEELRDARRRLFDRRRNLRHLFRTRQRDASRGWSKHWATVSAFQGRLQQVLKAQGQHDPRGDFMYALHRWSSSAVHGGPYSMGEVLDVTNGAPVAVGQPEADPAGAMSAATLTLLVHSGVLANDVGVAEQLDPELTTLKEVVDRWVSVASK